VAVSDLKEFYAELKYPELCNCGIIVNTCKNLNLNGKEIRDE
jgi:hypothetical protein